MHFLSLRRNEILILLGFVVIYLGIRLYHLGNLPIFTDEAIYVRWVQIAKEDAFWRFISLTDGKGPLFVWIGILVLKFIKDPLIAVRLISVGSGIVAMIGLFFLGRELFKNSWVGILSALLYLLFPMALVYDRMALYESLVSVFIVWSLLFEIVLVRSQRLDVALILGMIMGAGVLTKSNVFFTLALLPFSLLLLDTKIKDKTKTISKLVGLGIVACFLAYILYSVQRLSPFFSIINEKNHLFVYSFSDWTKHPIKFLYGNLVGLTDWFIHYVSWPILTLMLLAFAVGQNMWRQKVLLLIWFSAPFFYLADFGKVLYPRFLLFTILPLIPLAAFSLFWLSTKVRNKSLYVVICAVIFILYVRTDYYIVVDFANAPIPQPDKDQYMRDWTGGGGVKEAVTFFESSSKKQKIHVYTQGTFGLMPFALEIYLHKNPNIAVTGIWPIGQSMPEEITQEAKKQKTYVLFYQPCLYCDLPGLAPKSWNLQLVYRFNKPLPRYLSIYQVNP